MAGLALFTLLGLTHPPQGRQDIGSIPPTSSGPIGHSALPYHPHSTSLAEIFRIFLRLGLTSFGGPSAHLSYFRHEFVTRRGWLNEQSYAHLVALCQFLPGPASSQIGLAVGLFRGGYAGALAAWAGFTLPSAIMLIVFAQGLSRYGQSVPAGILHGLKIVTVAVVVQAIWSMGRQLCPDTARRALMLAACGVALCTPSPWSQFAAIGLAGVLGLLLFRPPVDSASETFPLAVSCRAGAIWLGIFLAILAGLPLLRSLYPQTALAMFDAFYRTGALVFGGGHVVLPLLQAEVVGPGWVSRDTFLAGYGAAQAIPGPLFAFAAFLGASLQTGPGGWWGGTLGLLAIFIPSFFLVAGALPFWTRLRQHARLQAGLLGVQAAVVGLLLAALVSSVWPAAIHTLWDFGWALLALGALQWWKIAPWGVVLGSALIGGIVIQANAP